MKEKDARREILTVKCEAEKEDLEHFILRCPEYRKERRKVKKLQQQPYQEDVVQKVIQDFLFGSSKEEAKDLVYKFWRMREKKHEELQRRRQYYSIILKQGLKHCNQNK